MNNIWIPLEWVRQNAHRTHTPSTGFYVLCIYTITEQHLWNYFTMLRNGFTLLISTFFCHFFWKKTIKTWIYRFLSGNSAVPHHQIQCAVWIFRWTCHETLQRQEKVTSVLRTKIPMKMTTYEWMVLSPCLAFFTESSNSDSRHFDLFVRLRYSRRNSVWKWQKWIKKIPSTLNLFYNVELCENSISG